MEINDEQKKALSDYFTKHVDNCNTLAAETSTGLASECIVKAAVRYATYHILEGGHLDSTSEMMITDKVLRTILEGVSDCIDNIRPPKQSDGEVH